MRLVASLAVLTAFAMLAGCQSAPLEAKAPEPPTELKLAKGTPVEFMLLGPVSSGECPVGMLLPMVVAEDVMVDGHIAIPKGTRVSAAISQSREAGALSNLMNQPARLAVGFEPLEIGQAKLTFSASADAEKPAEYAFTRDNTGRPDPTPSLEEALKNEATKQLLQELSDAIESGSIPEDLSSRISADPGVKKLLDDAGLGQANALMGKAESSEKGFRRLMDTANELRDGKLGAATGAEATLAIAAIEEIGSLANDVQRSLKAVFKGRNIRAFVGTRVKAYVFEDAVVKPQIR